MKYTLIDGLIITGVCLAVVGLWQAWPPLAAIVGGGLLLAAGVWARLHNNTGGDDGNA